MKVLYVAKAFEENLGANTHYDAVKEIIPKEDLFTIDLRPKKNENKYHYISYGKYSSVFERIHRWIQGNMMFISDRIINELLELIEKEKIEIVYIDDSVFGNLVKKIKKEKPNVKVISFYHDIKADLYKQWKKKSQWFDKIEYSIGIKQERINSNYCDVNVVLNNRDAKLFEKIYGKKPESIIPVSAPSPTFTDEEKERMASNDDQKVLLFVGKKYYPNIVGIKWFSGKVAPLLQNNVIVQVIGRGLDYLKDEINDSHVEVIGEVDSLDDYYKNADIVIAPLFDGGGMKLKTVEAMSYGKMIIATEESLQGFWESINTSMRNKMIFKLDEPDEWIDTINKLSTTTIKKYNEEVFELFDNNYSYESLVSKYTKLFD